MFHRASVHRAWVSTGRHGSKARAGANGGCQAPERKRHEVSTASPASRLVRTPRPSPKLAGVTTETVQVTGIRCERCVLRLGRALEGHEGLEFANANLLGQVVLEYDEQRTSLDALLAS